MINKMVICIFLEDSLLMMHNIIGHTLVNRKNKMKRLKQVITVITNSSDLLKREICTLPWEMSIWSVAGMLKVLEFAVSSRLSSMRDGKIQ